MNICSDFTVDLRGAGMKNTNVDVFDSGQETRFVHFVVLTQEKI